MLKGLARWLRAAGYDTWVEADGSTDRQLLDRACAEERWLLTRDRQLPEFKGAAGRVILLHGNDLDACARELSRQLPVDWLWRPFSRCLICNTLLRPATPAERNRVPPGSREMLTRVDTCPSCGRLYWDGTHVRGMLRRLRAWQDYRAN